VASGLGKFTSAMDRLYEFDREPVAPDKLQSGGKFAGLFAGEHVAATEFIIGAFFVLHGVPARELLLGLLFGNILAVLSWTFICAPIALRTRLTLYWYLRKIAGPGVTFLYNIANAFLYCILAGAMISVSATAVGLLFGIKVPALDAVFPTSAGWVAIVFVLGAAFTTMAILGFEKLSRFAEICSPWIFVIFIAGALAMLPKLGVERDLSNLWQVATAKIWNGVAAEGQETFGFWHILFFAWFCNLAMHVGLSDMAIFRYAKKWTYGFYTAFGMFPGHMLAWLCSGVMVAAVGRQMDPGLMAFEAAGAAGIGAVLLAGRQPDSLPGRAGPSDRHSQLAEMENHPAGRDGDNRPRLLPGVFPEAPGLRRDLRPGAHARRRHRLHRTLDLPAPEDRTAQGGEEGLGLQLGRPWSLGGNGRHLFPPARPPLFQVAAGLVHRRGVLHGLDGMAGKETGGSGGRCDHGQRGPRRPRREDEMKMLLAVASLASLALCLAAPVLFFLGVLPEASFKLALLFASLGWFFLATSWASFRKRT
jgi:hypothetical protein